MKNFPIDNGPKLSDADIYPDYLLSESEKYAKDKKKLKIIFDYHEGMAEAMLAAKRKKYIRRYKLAYGILNAEDFGLTEDELEDFDSEINLLKEEKNEERVKLDNFPLIPNIVRSLTHELNRKYHNFILKMVDTESLNEINRGKTQEIIDFLVQQKMVQMEIPQNAGPEEQQQIMSEFQKLPEIQEYYSLRYKPEAVKICEALVQRDELRFNMDRMEEEVFEDQVIQAERFFHVQDFGSDYAPEVLNPLHCAYTLAPGEKDVNQSVWFYWKERTTLQGMITKYGHFLDADMVKKLKSSGVYTNLTVDDSWYNIKPTTNEVTKKNWFALKEIISQTGPRAINEIDLAHQYFLIPRKLARLTVRVKVDALNSQDIYSDIIDPDDYKVIKEPKYQENQEKKLDTLIEGEHLDYFYINEVWYGIKASGITGDTVINVNDKQDLKDLWIKLEKLDYQGKPDQQLFGTVIPVFGGITNKRGAEFNKSLVDDCAGYQVYFDYLMNKIRELAITELMPFYIANQALIGADSRDNSWKENALFKFVQAGQEHGITIGDNEEPLFNGQPLAQLINVDRSVAIKTRIEMAMLFKNECYAQVGLSPQFMSQIGPEETATGVLQGVNRSLAQIDHLYRDHYELMRKVKTYMLELAQYKVAQGKVPADISYITTDGQELVLKVDPTKIPLSKSIGIYMEDSVKANEILERMKMFALNNNTVESDSYEKLKILSANSYATLLDDLLKERQKREAREEAAYQNQSQMQEQAINSNMEAQLAKQEFEATQNQLDREKDIIVAQLRGLGNSRNPDANADGTFDVLEVAKVNSEINKAQADTDINNKKLDAENSNRKLELESKLQDIHMKGKSNHENYLLKLKELDTKLQMSRDQLLIAQTNKNKYDKSSPKKRDVSKKR